MDNLREIKQALVDAEALFETDWLLIWSSGSAITDVVCDFFWTSKVDKVQVTTRLHVLFILLDDRINLESKECMWPTRAMIEKSFSVMPIFLAIFDQLEDLINRSDIDFISPFNDQIFTLIFMNV